MYDLSTNILSYRYEADSFQPTEVDYDAEGRLRSQLESVLTTAQQDRQDAADAEGHLRSQLESALTTAQQDRQDAVDGRYYQIQAASTGAETKVGPIIELCKIALEMETIGKHGLHAQLDISKCSTLPKCDWGFLDSQINAMAFMLQRSTGGIPVSADRVKNLGIACLCL